MSAQLALDLLGQPDGPLAPVAREPISIRWPAPETERLTPKERNEALARDLRVQEDINRWFANREKALVDELLFMRSYIRAVATGSETFHHRYTTWRRQTPEQDAQVIWRWVLASAEANRVMEDSIMGPHRPPRPDPAPPPHDIREFDWDECRVYRHVEAGEWRIGWRGGDVCVLRPYPVEAMQASVPPFWDILGYPSRKAAQQRLDSYRADVDAIRREWQAQRASVSAPEETDRNG